MRSRNSIASRPVVDYRPRCEVRARYPEGILYDSPGCRLSGYPGEKGRENIYPNGVLERVAALRNPFRVKWMIAAAFPG